MPTDMLKCSMLLSRNASMTLWQHLLLIRKIGGAVYHFLIPLCYSCTEGFVQNPVKALQTLFLPVEVILFFGSTASFV